MPRAPRDYWLAFAGRFLFILAILMITVFQLYLLTDHLHLSLTDAGLTVALGTVLVGVRSGISVIVAGLLSDRLQRRKPFVIGARCCWRPVSSRCSSRRA